MKSTQAKLDLEFRTFFNSLEKSLIATCNESPADLPKSVTPPPEAYNEIDERNDVDFFSLMNISPKHKTARMKYLDIETDRNQRRNCALKKKEN